ncbi:MAG: hypothetical protein QXE91_06430, partial [Thermofilaceae archaeon]
LLNKLIEITERHERQLSKLIEVTERHEQLLSKLVEVSERHEQRLSELTKAVEELRRITEMQAKQLERHEQLIIRLSERVDSCERRLSRIERDVRSMKRTLDRMSISLEEEANDMVTYFLKQRGYELETRPTRFDTKYEFDIYGSNGKLTVIGEAKVRAGPRSVSKLLERIRRARELWPERFQGAVVPVLYCMRAEPGVIEAAEREGVWLLESMRERVPPRI